MSFRTFAASEHGALLRLASSLPVGDEARRAILAQLMRAPTHYMDVFEDLEDAVQGLRGNRNWAQAYHMFEESRDLVGRPDHRMSIDKAFTEVQRAKSSLDKSFSLLRLASSLPVGDETRRALLLRLAQAPPPERREGEADKPTSSKKPSGILIKFLKEFGDTPAVNPDTGNRVKLKTLSSKPKSTPAYRVFEQKFKAWLKKQDEKAEAPKSEKAEAEEAPKSEKAEAEEAPKSEKAEAEKAEAEKAEAPKAEKAEKAEKAPKAKPFKAVSAEFVPSDKLDEYGQSQNPRRAKWTSSQRSAAKLYSSNEYRYINAALRKGSAEDYASTVEDLDSLFDSPQGKLNKPVKVTRGVGDSHPLVELVNSAPDNLTEGFLFEDLAYQSTSIRTNMSWGSYTLEITVPKGSRAVYLGPPPDSFSDYPSEKELLLDRGTKMRVTKYDPETKRIHLQVI